VGYEVFLLAVPDGADVEETGEALLVRLQRGQQRANATPESRARAEGLAGRLAAAEPELARTGEAASGIAGAIEMRTRAGLEVALADRFARFLVPFAHSGEAAATAFRQLFTLLAVAAGITGWRAYDPQEGTAAAIDDEGCASALEIYLSVMDQLRPAGSAGPIA
jgi:hypothetical protein